MLLIKKIQKEFCSLDQGLAKIIIEFVKYVLNNYNTKSVSLLMFIIIFLVVFKMFRTTFVNCKDYNRSFTISSLNAYSNTLIKIHQYINNDITSIELYTALNELLTYAQPKTSNLILNYIQTSDKSILSEISNIICKDIQILKKRQVIPSKQPETMSLINDFEYAVIKNDFDTFLAPFFNTIILLFFIYGFYSFPTENIKKLPTYMIVVICIVLVTLIVDFIISLECLFIGKISALKIFLMLFLLIFTPLILPNLSTLLSTVQTFIIMVSWMLYCVFYLFILKLDKNNFKKIFVKVKTKLKIRK